ncbi:MAG: hypothetical protein IKN63_00580 [Bacilli bacterium]|nr:hypothetical protein [Bacilli bacterium]
MLDDFKDNSFYKYACNLKKYYHAYIFEVDDIETSFPMILSFAKMIICKNHYTEESKCGDCNICHLIDNNTYQDLKIIEPMGASIRKEQVIELQKDLSLKSFNNTNQVYIIKEADKMNISTANSILKFIEEPQDGIYGILITTNRKALLSTIISRCILISLKTKKEEQFSLDDIENLSLFLKKLFKEKERSLAYIKQDFFHYYELREDIIKAFNIMEAILDCLIQKKYHQELVLNSNSCDIIETNLGEISLNNIINCLEKVVIYKNKLLTVLNINVNLLMDRFVIDVSEVL